MRDCVSSQFLTQGNGCENNLTLEPWFLPVREKEIVDPV
jgi:hypothetical protein